MRWLVSVVERIRWVRGTVDDRKPRRPLHGRAVAPLRMHLMSSALPFSMPFRGCNPANRSGLALRPGCHLHISPSAVRNGTPQGRGKCVSCLPACLIKIQTNAKQSLGPPLHAVRWYISFEMSRFPKVNLSYYTCC